jgi:hypothetical protein
MNGIKEEIWILLKLFYNQDKVQLSDLSESEINAIHNFGATGGTSHLVSFGKKKAYVKLSNSGKRYLATFISSATYLR